MARLKKGWEPMETTLSCLRCLEYLSGEPLTLVCGHSICRKCFTTHSDPKSQDSLVFCEECKIETKNKNLKESKVIITISDRFAFIKNIVDDISKTVI